MSTMALADILDTPASLRGVAWISSYVGGANTIWIPLLLNSGIRVFTAGPAVDFLYTTQVDRWK